MTEIQDSYDQALFKEKLALMVLDAIHDRGWSQTFAAKQLGVSQPRISNLENGKYEKFSVDMLIRLACALGYRMEIDHQPSQSLGFRFIVA